jgi:hypothetical protein
MSPTSAHQLALSQSDLEWDNHATGWIQLLSVGWQVLTLPAFVVRRRLVAARTKLTRLSIGNLKWAAAQLTAGRPLEAFQKITLTVIPERYRQRHLTPLTLV